MKKTIWCMSIAAVLWMGCSNNGDNKDKTLSSLADTTKKIAEVKPGTPPPVMDSVAMQKAFDAFKTPGPMQKWMEKTNGTWDAEVSQWMNPKAPPVIVKAANTQISAMGGRYVIGKYSSTMMGKPFDGMSVMGYDNAKKVYVSNWIDNSGTGMTRMMGTYDEPTKTLNLKGTQTDPLTGKDADIREEMTLLDDNTYNLVIYGTGADGKEMKFMEGTFKRRK
ncbi:MAG: DUF1579 domain-containing protein [Bacteroidetes bacterium]|nr:DUF1579 domain-containing protein [Bacteroidota bacterium]